MIEIDRLIAIGVLVYIIVDYTIPLSLTHTKHILHRVTGR
jgi:hypothetical protein